MATSALHSVVHPEISADAAEPSTVVGLPDPHASKVPPDHPGLLIKRPLIRSFRRGPLAIFALTVMAVGGGGFVLWYNGSRTGGPPQDPRDQDTEKGGKPQYAGS